MGYILSRRMGTANSRLVNATCEELNLPLQDVPMGVERIEYGRAFGSCSSGASQSEKIVVLEKIREFSLSPGKG